MCGIFGIIQPTPVPFGGMRQFCVTASETLKHRGPDGSGIDILSQNEWVDHLKIVDDTKTEAIFGHTRLAILDLSQTGRQPMHTRDQSVSITFNGEVYNYIELRKELTDAGHSFDGNSDSEVVLKSWLEWGPDAINRWTGMFALAVFDARQRSVYLVRDPFGIKPLYYATTDSHELIFASEPAVLLNHNCVSRKANLAKSVQYLQFGDYDCDEHTMLNDVKQVQPGHFLRWDVETHKVKEKRQHWNPRIQTSAAHDFNSASDHFRELMLDSVRLHLRSDVPLGVALSGGLDSSSLACIIRHVAPDIQLRSFSFIDEGERSERQWIRAIEDSIATVPHHISIGEYDLDREFDDFVLSLGEPIGGSSVFAHFKVAQATRKHGVKVTLEGQGADELLGGYHGYSGLRLSTMLRRLQLHRLVPFAIRSSRWPGRSYGQLLRECLKDLEITRSNSNSLIPAWLDLGKTEATDILSYSTNARQHHESGCERLKLQLKFQLLTRGLPSMMRHGDRTSMQFSVESRVPFLTTPIAEFLYSLPEEFLVDSHGTSKSILRHAMRDIVPDEILDRRDKIGFATSESTWMLNRQEWVREILTRSRSISFIATQELLQYWDNIVAGQTRYSPLVWRWINYIRWTELMNISA